MIHFEWDDAKAAENLEKHGISFELATGVFDDLYAIEEDDQVVDGEVRLRTIGIAGGIAVIAVSHTNRPADKLGDEIVRMISARTATRSERRRYDELRSESGWNPFE
jgi:uncharacterized DUF497 family protein